MALIRTISEPRYLLKICGSIDELREALPPGWELHAPGYFMRATNMPPCRRLPHGCRIEVRLVGMVIEARIFSETGALAASGYAAEAEGVFVYDRIVTEPEYRRRGLGHALMQALHNTRRNSAGPEVLVATKDGFGLYTALGWVTISPYSTASIIPR
jgi:GNAT superfamily N-acetyltransferase